MPPPRREAQEEHRTMRLLSSFSVLRRGRTHFGSVKALAYPPFLPLLLPSSFSLSLPSSFLPVPSCSRADRIVDASASTAAHFSSALRRGHAAARAAAQKWRNTNKEVSPRKALSCTFRCAGILPDVMCAVVAFLNYCDMLWASATCLSSAPASTSRFCSSSYAAAIAVCAALAVIFRRKGAKH